MRNGSTQIPNEIKAVSAGNHLLVKDRKFDLGRYLGTSHYLYRLSNPQARKLAKEWVKENQNLSEKEVIEVLNNLYQGKSLEEKTIPSFTLEYLPKIRASLDPQFLDIWLNYLEGWAEIDTLCAGPWTAEDFLNKWDQWKNLLKHFVKDNNITKRRASLVLLVKPVRQSADQRLSKLAFENIDLLKSEKDVLISKAISWLLRSLITNNKKEVEEYLREHSDTLPKIVVRETTRKLLTGKK